MHNHGRSLQLVLITTGIQRWKNQLTSSVAKFLAELKLAGTMVAFLAATGCTADWFSSPLADVQSRTTSTSSGRADTREINAGIIFAGQASYLCLPLTELGLDGVHAASDVAALSTSCACVHASLVAYHRSSTQSEDALRLDFTPDEPTDREHRPAHLAVEVTLQLSSGSQRTLRVNLLETQLVASDPRTDSSEHDQGI